MSAGGNRFFSDSSAIQAKVTALQGKLSSEGLFCFWGSRLILSRRHRPPAGAFGEAMMWYVESGAERYADREE